MAMEALNSKFKASLISGTQETTLTLANLNFDFSLYKVEAPKEYQGLGNTLSNRRREAAENGSEHIFARRLGALFSDILPSTPNLHRVYGIRASEIAKSSATNLPASQNHGIFDDWIGADATSIWAAATSGPGAIAVHLLACMLARVWQASEATAIWDEIIQERKREVLEMDHSEPLHIATLAAVRVEITRDQMSSWDASARAWLEVADLAKKREQTQLKLLLKHTQIPVNQKMRTYSSVIDAWKTAMLTVDKLISGMGYRVEDGAVLLGLASWHLYPDLYALQSNSRKVTLNDPLIAPGGIVTLGISNHSPDSAEGVYWSLPLAYLRYYGDPVHSVGAVGEVSTRLTISECFLVILGSVFAGWRAQGVDLTQASKLVVALWDCALSSKLTKRRPSHWLQHLAQAAEAYISSAGMQRKIFESLISRGKRRYGSFLAELVRHPHPMFGIAYVRDFLRLIPDMEEKIAALRFIAKNLNAPDGSLLIRYRQLKPEQADSAHTAAAIAAKEGEDVEQFEWAYATALMMEQRPRKRKSEPNLDSSGHTRWVNLEWTVRNGEHFEDLSKVEVTEQDSTNFIWNSDITYLTADPDVSTRKRKRTKSSEDVPSKELYTCIVGDPEEAAIFKRAGVPASGSEEISIDLLINALEASWIDPITLLHHLDSLEVGGFLRSLRAFAAAADAYSIMPDATVSATIFSKPLGDARWIADQSGTKRGTLEDISKNASKPPPQSLIYGSGIDPRLIFQEPQLPLKSSAVNPAKQKQDGMAGNSTEWKAYSLSREQTFACIAMFENRSVNLDPDLLQQVMAISAGNSIYVAMPLICDPSDTPLGHEVKRILGNIGKPGICLMIPPISPKVRKLDDDNWHQVNHARFDGNVDDCFQRTSMHLSFTKYTMPATVTTHGDQAIEANFIETLVSVFDREKWVGDLDILRALSSPHLLRMDANTNCQHTKGLLPKFPLTCIDSWDEYIDKPDSAAIFRAHENVYARLSAAALNAQMGSKTVLFRGGNDVCWICMAEFCEKHGISLSPDHYDEISTVPLFIC